MEARSCSATSRSRWRQRRPTSASNARRRSGAGCDDSKPSSSASAGCCARRTPIPGSCSQAILGSRRFDAFWIVGGRVADWGELPSYLDEIEARTAAALARAPRPGETAHVPAEEIDEVRIVAGWLASHDARVLALDPAPDRDALAAFVDVAQPAGLTTQNSR